MRTYLVQNEWDGDEGDGQEAQQTRGPVNTELGVHGIGKQWEAGTERTPEKVVTSQDGGGIFGVRVRQVVQNAVEQQERADGEPSCADDGHDPVDICTRCPTEPEQADGDAEATDHGRDQPLLRGNVALVVETRLQVVLEVGEEWRNHDERANQDTKVCHALEAQTETVNLDEDDDERFEPNVQQAVDECNVQVEQEDHGLSEVEGEGPNERHQGNILRGHFLTHELSSTHELIISSDLAQTACAADQDVVGTGLRHEEEQEDEAEGTEPHEFPDGPSPWRGKAAKSKWAILNSETTDQGSESRTADRCDAPDTHGVRSLDWRVHVAEGGAASGEDRRSEEACQESERQQHAKVAGKSCGCLESNEDEESGLQKTVNIKY